MNIILVSSRSAKARSYSLKYYHVLAVALLALALLVVTALGAQYAIIRFQSDALSPALRDWLASARPDEQKQQQSYLRDGLDAMAGRLGKMQAQLLRLDALGARLAKQNGIKPQEIDFDQPAAQGGPYIPADLQQVTLQSLQQQTNDLSALLSDRSDKLATLETLQLQTTLGKTRLPSKLPVVDGQISSGFGFRIDPFTGKLALHEGLDFIAPEGTPIYASASGIVVYAGIHPQYGNMIEIDHGNGIVTRYGHASRLQVKVGQMVKRGQEIAEVGNSGRSTGAHLHFEVRYRGIAQNPRRFLQFSAG